MKLIHFPMTRSLRPLWLIEEANIECEVETRVFDRPALKEPDYLALNPLGKTPVFFDGEKRIFESTAILHYLVETKTDGAFGRKPGDDDYHSFLQWLHFGEAGMGGYVNMLIAHTALMPEEMRNADIAEWAKNETINCLNYIDASLGDRQTLLDEFSICDISVGYALFLIKVTRNGKIIPEKTAQYFEAITSRAGWKAATAHKP